MTTPDPDRVPLLGRLITIWADRHEVTATFALTVLLEDDSVARRFTAWLAKQAGVGLPEQLTYRCELALDGGRVDVAGEDGDTVRVACEAKFGAPLESGQLAHYANAAPKALVVVLVPENRWNEEHGHLWMPLHPPLGVGGQEVVRQLVDQARELHEITRPAIGC